MPATGRDYGPRSVMPCPEHHCWRCKDRSQERQTRQRYPCWSCRTGILAIKREWDHIEIILIPQTTQTLVCYSCSQLSNMHDYTQSNGAVSKQLVNVNMWDSSRESTTLCWPYFVRSSLLIPTTLTPLMAELSHLFMLFVLLPACIDDGVGQLENK